VHLKSNYGARKPEVKAANAAKRAAALRQVLEAAADCGAGKIIIAGDFNADRFQREFAEERIFTLLDDDGFTDGWRGEGLPGRGTHPGSGRYPDSTLDYVFHKGFEGTASRRLAPFEPVSDHRMVVMELK